MSHPSADDIKNTLRNTLAGLRQLKPTKVFSNLAA